MQNETRNGRVALFEGPGTAFDVRSYNVRPLQPGEVLVKNEYTTICGSDLHTYCGLRNEPTPTVLGHEIVGEILEIAASTTLKDLCGHPLAPGDRITWTIFASDPQSVNALRNMPQKGDHLFKYGHARVQEPEVFHGGLGTYCILKPNTGIIKLPRTIPLPIAATLNCSVATVAGALRLAGDLRGKNVVVTGLGHLGITCTAMCREAGAAWVAGADVAPVRLAAAQAFGANYLGNMQEPAEIMQEISRQTNGRGVDVAIDLSGSPDAMEFGLRCLGIGGCTVWVGAVFNTRPLSISPEHVIRNLLSIRGLHNYNYDDFVYAFRFIESHWQTYPFQSATEKEFPLSEVQAAFEYALAQKPLRVGIRPS